MDPHLLIYNKASKQFEIFDYATVQKVPITKEKKIK